MIDWNPSCRLRRIGVAATALLFLAGCVTNGDFGRVRASLVSDGIHASMGPVVAAGMDEPHSAFRLTDDELLLRDLGYPLMSPLDPNGYATWLPAQEAFRSSEGVYERLIEDIRDDITRLEPFCTVAARVADMDRKRHKSMAYVIGLTEYERKNAVRRIRENTSIVDAVLRSLHQRAVSYRTALERLVIAIPSRTAVETERTLTLLRQQIAAACAAPVHVRVRGVISEQAAGIAVSK